jgi:hypothetical protein
MIYSEITKEKKFKRQFKISHSRVILLFIYVNA